jgi:cardiolipin synthase
MRKINFGLFKRLPLREKRITISTRITLLRIMLVPVIVFCIKREYWGSGFWFFVIAAISDVFDGALARWRNEQTFLGACLDPLADKLLILSVFCAFTMWQSPSLYLPLWFMYLVFIKEIVLVAGSIILYVLYEDFLVTPTVLGKITTFVQCIFIGWMFVCYFFTWMPTKTYAGIIIIMAGLVVATFMDYVRVAVKRCYKGA